MSNWKCHACEHDEPDWEATAGEYYPNGPCPVSCPICGAYCCPDCGGEMGKSIDDGDEADSYTSGGCYRCDYHCCGGCI